MTRRSLLKKWLSGVFFTVLTLPVISFWKSQRYRPPLERRISRVLKPGQFLVEPEFVLFETSKGPVAVSRTCTHLGCRINFIEEKSMFLCPCHQSKFTKSGKYIAGPAKKDLQKFKVKTLENGAGYLVYIPR
ncbi:MAG: Rieske 2Fe-2S domain-containing protein [Thermodesulfobacteria bacterium]|nr:Rieske 2Fe-2S domain-containing protein [Thermodesulfobacteriota bacterium]